VLGFGLGEQEVGEGQAAHRLAEAAPHEAASVGVQAGGYVHRGRREVVGVPASPVAVVRQLEAAARLAPEQAG
jgi:hypothetical protein